MRAYDFVTRSPLQLDQHRVFLIDDIALTRPSPPLSPFIGSGSTALLDPLQREPGMIERCVVVQRQKDGYGLTVTGEHPLYVYTVRPEGAAFCAGVRQGDRILKVNGMPVTSSNYAEVVRMISDGQNVALTLLGKPPDHVEIKGDPDYKTPDIKSFKSIEQLRDSYLTPQMLSPEERAVNRRQTIERMLEDERRNIQGLRFTNEKKEKLDQALLRVERLKSQLSLKSDTSWMHSSATAELLAHEGGDSDDDDDLSVTHPLDTQIPFTSLIELKSRPAHLALFLEYLITNANPASLLFYLITDAYQTCTASAKELRRWAFEIFSTFLIPNGPLGVSHDQTILNPIDKMLNSTTTHVTEGEGEKLRKIFSAARQRALIDVNDHLNDFRQKKDMGIGPSFDTSQLGSMSKGDLSVEQRLGENKLMKQLEVLLNSANNEYENCEPKTQAIISSIATVIKVVLAMKPSVTQWERMLEKCPTFLMKEKNSKFKMKTSTPKRNLQVKGHVFSFNPVNVVHYCYQCRDAIWGIQANGYFCLNCDVVVHKNCTSSLVDSCYPATQKKATKKTAARSSARDDEDAEVGRAPVVHDHNVKSTSSDSGIGYEVIERRGDVARSQSMKSRLSHMTTTTLSEDVRLVPRGRSALSWGADLTPAHQLDETPLRRNALTELCRPPSDIQSISGASSISHDDDVRRLISSMTENDSDMEVDTEVPTLESLVSWDVVRHLKPKEKKRQEVINELFHTERTHVRNLKILYSIFYKPMMVKNTVSQDLLWLFFANIEELLGIHKEMCRKMRDQVDEWRKESSLNGLYGDIGNLMEDLFEGENGEKLKQATSLFCQHQQHALEILRSRCNKKEDHFSRWLVDVESHPLCRKLQLKDMLPVEMQRLVKYPMLLETAAKYTQEENEEEQEKLYRVVHESKKILSAVNTAKRNAENLRRLEELQRRLDTTPFDKENSGGDYASLDLTKYHLIHDGHLTMRFSRGKMVELHVILLEDILVMLTRHSDGNKLMLKSLDTSKETKWPPILPIKPLIVKEKANDKRAFFLLPNPDTKGAHIAELVAATATERKTWLKLMSDQIEYVKKQPTVGIEPFKFEVGTSTVEGEGLDKVQVLTHPRLVNANEITVQQPTVLEHAKAVLTPTERLKRNDQLIFQALLDKQTILANFLPGDATNRAEQLTKLTELLGGLNVADLKQRDPKELAMSAIVHGNRLLDSINQGMQAHKESEDGSTVTLVLDDPDRHLPSVPCYKLTAIGAPLMNHLKALMQVIQSQEAELATVKQQLCRYKDMAEASGCDRSVSEETLTDVLEERKLVTKRQNRAPSVPTCPPPLM